MDGECDGNGARPGADIDELHRLTRGEECEDSFDEMLGLRTRDENCGADVEAKAVELLLAGDVLDGLELAAAVDGDLIESVLLGGEVAVWICDQGDTGDLQRVEEKKFGVAVGVFVEMWVGGQLGCGVGDGLAEGHAGGYLDCG